jgi:hypothetical protein
MLHNFAGSHTEHWWRCSQVTTMVVLENCMRLTSGYVSLVGSLPPLRIPMLIVDNMHRPICI